MLNKTYTFSIHGTKFRCTTAQHSTAARHGCSAQLLFTAARRGCSARLLSTRLPGATALHGSRFTRLARLLGCSARLALFALCACHSAAGLAVLLLCVSLRGGCVTSCCVTSCCIGGRCPACWYGGWQAVSQVQSSPLTGVVGDLLRCALCCVLVARCVAAMVWPRYDGSSGGD